jgi:hypothetical protein
MCGDQRSRSHRHRHRRALRLRRQRRQDRRPQRAGVRRQFDRVGTVPLHGAPNVTLSAVGINAAHLARAFLTGRREETGTAGDVDVTATCAAAPAPPRCASRRRRSPRAGTDLRPASASGTLRWSNGNVQVTNGRAQLDRVRVEGTDAGNVRAAFATAGPAASGSRRSRARASAAPGR